MAFNNIPPNGFPALPDVEYLEAVEKDVTSLKSSVLGLTQDVTDLNAQKANLITIAPFFNAESSYDVGDLVYYNGLSYRCTNAHEGEWDADDFASTTIANELDTLKSGLTNLTSNAYGNYVDLSSYTSDPYTCDSDGYLLMATNTTSTITVYVYGRIGNDYMSVSSVNGINTTVYVRKGMRLLVHDTTGTSTVARFYPLVV